MNNQTPLTHIYLLAMTSNTDDQYNEKNYAFRNKENAEKELRNIFTEILNSWENDCTEHELKKAKDELEQSLKETNEELYQPTFELWTCYGFIKGTITKTKIQ